MMRYKKYLSVFLLLLLAWVLMPPVLMHHVFADHEDTACDFEHRHDITTVESKHTHCDIFTTNAPVYDTPELILLAKPFRFVIAEIQSGSGVLFSSSAFYFIPARAPPAI